MSAVLKLSILRFYEVNRFSEIFLSNCIEMVRNDLFHFGHSESFVSCQWIGVLIGWRCSLFICGFDIMGWWVVVVAFPFCFLFFKQYSCETTSLDTTCIEWIRINKATAPEEAISVDVNQSNPSRNSTRLSLHSFSHCMIRFFYLPFQLFCHFCFELFWFPHFLWI